MAYDDEKPRDTLARRYGPLQESIGKPEMNDYLWKKETGDIQSYKHKETGAYLHIDSQGQFYDRVANPIERKQALETAPTKTIEKSQPQEYALGL